MPEELLRATEAARRLGMPTKDLLRLIYDREIGYVMRRGIAHVPAGVVNNYRRNQAS